MKTEDAAPKAFWPIIGLLFFILLLNYFDRQTLSILKTTLKDALAFDDEDYSKLILAFMLPYIAMYVVSGWLIDRLGTRKAMVGVVSVWSVASILSGFSQTFTQLAASRALLGVAEPVAFPLSQKVILNWAPERRRAFVMGIIAPAGSVGAVLAPGLVAWLALTLGWRGAFVVPGIIGLAAAIAWWKLDRLPQRTETQIREETGPLPVRDLLRHRGFWTIVAARVVSDPVWFFFLFWIPGYLQERVGLSLQELGLVGGIPYLAAVAVTIFFGRFVDARVAKGRSAKDVQLGLFALTAALMPLGALITVAPNIVVAMAIITLVTAVAQSWFAGTGVLLAAVVPHRLNATALGFIGAIGASAGLLLNLAAGGVIERFGYVAVFTFLAFLHPLGAIILRLGIRRG